MEAKILENIHASFNEIAIIPDSQWKIASEFFYEKTLKKDEYFSAAGDKATEVAVVLSGILRIYIPLEDGREFIRDFKIPGTVVASYSSLISGDEAKVSIQARTDTVLAVIPYAKLEKLYEMHSCWQELGRKVAEFKFIEGEQREIELATLNAQEQYDVFCKRFPEVLGKVPQYDIASYLGISPVSLSRVISKSNKNNK